MKRILIAIAIFIAATPATAFAVDRDDDVKIESEDSIAYQQSSSVASSEIEAKFPKEAKEIRAAHALHVKHAIDKDVDAYMDDFKLERMRYPELEREYAQRAMNLDRLQIEVKAVEFSEITSTSATIHTRQVTQYDDETGTTHIDDAIISYRWIKDANANAWKIAFTERRRLSN